MMSITANIWTIVLITTIVVFIPCGRCTDTYSAETSLRNTLKSGYDTPVRPSTPTTVYLYYSIKALRNLDITTQTMSINGWTTMYWEDPRLLWQPSNNSNIEEIEVNWAWRPEYGIVNSIDTMSYIGADISETRVRVFYNGWVRWMQFMGSDTQCDVDIKMFPFDTQTCSVEIVFWGSSINDVLFNVTMEKINMMRYATHGEWQLESTSTSSMDVEFCCPASTHKMFYFTFVYSRMRPFYIMNILVPALLLSVCSMLVFYLPTDSGERLGYSLTILLSYTVQMSITSAFMPTTSKEVPHIAMYLLVVLVMCTLLLCNVVVHVKIYYLEGSPPPFIRKIYKLMYPVVFCQLCRSKNNKVKHQAPPTDKGNFESDMSVEYIEKSSIHSDMTVEPSESTDQDDGTEKLTWQQTSIFMDRCCFFLYATFIISLNIYFMTTLFSVTSS